MECVFYLYIVFAPLRSPLPLRIPFGTSLRFFLYFLMVYLILFAEGLANYLLTRTFIHRQARQDMNVCNLRVIFVS